MALSHRWMARSLRQHLSDPREQVRVRVRVRAIPNPNPNPNPNQYFATDHTPLVNGGLALQPGFALDAAQQVELVRVRG